MIEVKHLKTLQALAELRSLAAAAATLHQTQSALSHQFSDLEQRLGFRLFVRKSQPLRLLHRGKSCCNWQTRCCRKLARRCKPAMNRNRRACALPLSAIAVFSG
ncbi:LysR family transcriptional regulator [Escherichia coli]|uniref:LysR family transcriptional regulator n=1 Tax=Escherichia coli TaxID=562 RepID=UPI001CF42ACD|nr:LysR family transcriptional regulator [Escherichia coli]UCP50409.1 LysR family transcriptional regulator [Escherichia coli O157:H7]